MEFLIPGDCQGLRLDQALVRMIPGLGRRGARDLWTDFSVLVDGQRRAAGFRVQSGQKITLKTAQSATGQAATVNLFLRPVHPVLAGSKLPHRPRTIKPLRNENKKLRPAPTLPYNKSAHAPPFAGKVGAGSDSRSCQNGVNRTQYFRRIDKNKSALQEAQAALPAETCVRVVAQNDQFAALVKPAGMHSEALARGETLARGQAVRGRGSSIEAALPELFPKRRVVLLNRLDLPVSGLILVALSAPAAKDYALWQDQGQVHKRYLAVVHGRVPGDLEIRAALDTAKRRVVRVLSLDEPDCLRHTRVFPLTYREESDESLVCVEINKGRRHQIRAHLAWAGHPVQLDPLYGRRRTEDGGRRTESWIYLHHYRLELPGFAAAAFPDWL
jgi:23S rRNA pseudouridine1911/1915/1917 synthase